MSTQFLFQSTLPLRGATHLPRLFLSAVLFQSTLPLRGTTRPDAGMVRVEGISIHTPLAGNDMTPKRNLKMMMKFQSTLPLRGATCLGVLFCANTLIFQSTLPLRGATTHVSANTRQRKFQSTLPLRGATRRAHGCLTCRTNFNPHSPCGERPYHDADQAVRKIISIHTPLAGSDVEAMGAHSSMFRISIHTPLAGSDHLTYRTSLCFLLFQSTLPLRGATSDPCRKSSRRKISIHTPLAGSDPVR